MHHTFDSSFWEERYKNNQPATNTEPNPQLVFEVESLPPGKALDAGCGEGAAAIWLADRGWEVVALDISGTALARARKRALTISPESAYRIAWRQQDLMEWDPQEKYDLVVSQYVHLPGDFSDYCKKLATAVTAGGTLLAIAHQPPSSDKDDHHDRGSHVAIEQIVSSLDKDQWNIITAENRSRQVVRPNDKEITLHDTIVRAEKL